MFRQDETDLDWSGEGTPHAYFVSVDHGRRRETAVGFYFLLDNPADEGLMQKIHFGDVLEALPKTEAESVDLVFSDPPFNIGYDYDLYKDNKAPEDYVSFTRQWAAESFRVLAPNGSLWMCGSDQFISEMDIAVRQCGFHKRSWVIWYYTFGQNAAKNMTKSHTHIIYYTKHPKRFVFNADDPAVRHPSARQLVYKDKRANPAGRLPDDTWCILESQITELQRELDDVWFYPRVNGTFKERRGGHSCQMPEAILARIIRMVTFPGGRVLDLFAGTGTALAVCKKLGRIADGYDISPGYVDLCRKRLAEIPDLNKPA